MNQEQERKTEVLKFTDKLRAAGIATVVVGYSGYGDQGQAECIELQDADGNQIDESSLPVDVDHRTLGDLLEGFAPDGYENGEGGHGAISFKVETQTILVEHNWYETLSIPDEPREL